MNTLPSWKKLRNPDPKTITSPVGVPRRPGFRALDSTCMKFSMFIKKSLTFYLQTLFTSLMLMFRQNRVDIATTKMRLHQHKDKNGDMTMDPRRWVICQ